MKTSQWIASIGLIAAVVAAGAGLAAKKKADIQQSIAEAAMMPEQMEAVVVQTAREVEHRRTTTAVGSVLALRSVTLKNELAGTVAKVDLTPGKVVDAGEVLVALDVSVEEAELRALEAQAALTETNLKRVDTLAISSASSKKDLDQARAERDVALAQTERTRALIARKVLRAPFRARIGLSDVHPGQYLVEGTELTTLQGVDEAVYVDFTVTQAVAAGLKEGDFVEVAAGSRDTPVTATIVALDARIDRSTRSGWVRAKVADAAKVPTPGASVQVRVPLGGPRKVVAIPISGLRRGPQGDHVFVVVADKDGKPRAATRLVQAGAVQGDEVLIEKGLAAGEQIAASGSFKLREGVLVADMGKAPQAQQAQ